MRMKLRRKNYAECDDEEDRRDNSTFHAEITDIWGPRMVERRLIEAARLSLHTAGPVGPKQFGNAMPRYQRDWDDWLSQLDAGGKEEVDPVALEGNDRPPLRLGATSRQITRMEASIRWPIVYLEAFPGPRKVLAVYLRCKAYRKPFGRACKRLGWPRATAYRARDRALGEIAQGLNRDQVPVDN